MYGHYGDAALRMIAKAPNLYGKGLTPMGANGHRLEFEGCHRVGHVKRNQGLHQGQEEPHCMQTLLARSCPWALVGSNTFLRGLMSGHVSHGHSR